MTREIELTQNKTALINEEDYERVSALNWAAVKTAEGKYYARAWNPATKSKVYLHRFINETPEGMHTDHIDGDGLNNTRENLRTCTHRQNLLNRTKLRPRGTSYSQYKGVTLDKRTKETDRPWLARLSHSVSKACNRSQHIGRYASEEEAARAYDVVISELYGEFAKLNFREGA